MFLIEVTELVGEEVLLNAPAAIHTKTIALCLKVNNLRIPQTVSITWSPPQDSSLLSQTSQSIAVLKYERAAYYIWLRMMKLRKGNKIKLLSPKQIENETLKKTQESLFISN